MDSNIFKRKKMIILLLLVMYLNYWYLASRYLNDIRCHTSENGDALPAAEGEYQPKENSIFFHETSCKGGLDSRQACVVESAARLHPDKEVHVLFSGPISKDVLRYSCLAKLLEYPNIKLSRVHIAKYAKGTPLEVMLNSGCLKNSYWRVKHSSDILRILTLYKWGGIYLDTDVLAVKSFDYLGVNWVGREYATRMSNEVMAISKDELGRKFINDVVRELNNTYKPDSWHYNGSALLKRVLTRMCNASSMVEWNAENCQGFQVYGPDYFYPLHYSQFNQYFKAGAVIDTPKVFAHHFWDRFSKDVVIEKNSPYAMMASQFCPEIYKTLEESFSK